MTDRLTLATRDYRRALDTFITEAHALDWPGLDELIERVRVQETGRIERAEQAARMTERSVDERDEAAARVEAQIGKLAAAAAGAMLQRIARDKENRATAGRPGK
jgi:hypothetical protein